MSSKKLLLSIAAVLAAILAYGQTLHLRKDKLNVKEAMALITENTGCQFIYASGDIDTTRTVSLDASSLQQALQQSFEGQDLSFRVSGKSSIIKKEAPKPQKKNAAPDMRELSGTVVDETGLGIPGATVHIKGSTKGVLTDLEGNFSIAVLEGEVLTVSFLGYEDASFTAAGQNNIRISLIPKRNELEEDVLVA